MPEFKPTTDQLLQARRYDPNRQPPSEQFILTIGGKKIGSLQNLVTITGKQKNGKSRYVAAVIASGLAGKDIFEISLRLPANRSRIALFDTEQSEYDFYKQIRTIKELSGLTELPANFDAFNTREDDPYTTLQMLTRYLTTNPDCSLVFFDGLLDLLISFNDERDSKKLINLIKKITKQNNCLLVGVLHRGKGNDLTLGHLGSMADRVAQSVLKVEKNKERNTFCLSSEFLRSDEDFTPIEIMRSGNEWQQTFHIPADEWKPSGEGIVRSMKPKPHEIPAEEYHQKKPVIFADSDPLTYKELLQGIQEVFGTGRNWAVAAATHMREQGIIFRIDGKYTINPQRKIKL